MRNLYSLLSVLLVSVFIVFASCGDPDDPALTDTQERAKALSGGSWSQSTGTSVTVPDGVDPTILDNLTLVFGADADHNPTSFSSTGAPDFFTTSSSSTWSLSSVDAISLTNVEGGVSSITIGSGFSDTQMTLSFRFTTPAGRLAGGERISALDGDYIIEMTK
ncbi:hypothetical protein ACFLU5_15840 [Bacteroidota bacterium]